MAEEARGVVSKKHLAIQVGATVAVLMNYFIEITM